MLFVACSGSSKPAPAPVDKPTDDPNCPLVPGTSVAVEDTPTGAAIVFVTTGDVAELRKRVHAVADAHNREHEKMGPMPTGNEQGGEHHHDMHDMHDMGSGGEHGEGHMIMVHSKAVPEDVDGGVKVAFVVAPDDVGKMQTELREHAKHLQGGTCGH